MLLQAFRDHKRWLMFIAMVLIIPSFVVTGIYSYNRMSQSDNAIVKVGEVSITPEQFDYAKREQLERLRQALGENFHANMLESPEARADILRMLMDDSAVTQTVAKNYVAVSEAEAIMLIKNADALKQDGKFSPELYQQFLRSQGKSDQQFVAEVQRDLAKDVLIAGVSRTYPVPKAIVEQVHEILTNEREVRTFTINVADYTPQVKVTDEEVKAYYDANQKEFLSPEHVKAEYVVLSPADFKNIQANPEDIKAYYEQNQNRWAVPEQRRASHILIEFGDDKAAALKKTEALLAEVKADPSKFADIAKSESQDPGSASQGGDLSYFGRGVMTKAFEDAVFNAKQGEIIGPVETEFGYHIIEVTEIQAGSVQPFEAVKEEIEREYAEQMAVRTFSERADEFTNLVYEQSDSLAPVAEKFGLKVQTVDMVTRDGASDPEVARLVNDRVAEALFGSECLKEKRNSSAIEVQSNTLVAARVVEYFPQAERPLDEVKPAITSTLTQQKAAAMAKEAGEKKLAEVRASGSLEGFTDPVWVSRQVMHGHEVALINAELSIPSAKLPAFTGVELMAGSYVISHVENARSKQASEAEIASLARELSNIYGEADRTGYLDALKNTIGLTILRPDFVNGEEKQDDDQQ
ncbi:SurA N-terminal domain-containing protein [Sutterella sp.]|uniref:SurA N-terminal domain-containing protein n=1 Tax=Sutterella sp. TaxID=1981025 RepID=UPI0026DF1F1B|nr:SurA N-terminal domain-containing protein [Sutterella sp.]MDO5531637.1 SurA N-terminal domain-containing protein [Sutterella sp.]